MITLSLPRQRPRGLAGFAGCAGRSCPVVVPERIAQTGREKIGKRKQPHEHADAGTSPARGIVSMPAAANTGSSRDAATIESALGRGRGRRRTELTTAKVNVFAAIHANNVVKTVVANPVSRRLDPE